MGSGRKQKQGSGIIHRQLNPFERCHNRINGRPCMDARCSLECRRAWGRSEYGKFQARLQELRGVHIRVMTLKAFGPCDVEADAQARVRFKDRVRRYARGQGGDIQFRVVADIDRTGNVHYHGWLYSTVTVDRAIIERLWDEAWHGARKISVDIRPIAATAKAWSSYITKPDTARLFERNRRFRMTWGTVGFFGGKLAAFERRRKSTPAFIAAKASKLQGRPKPPLAGMFGDN